ncbi:hypothetical protein [Bacillus sp. FSL K6-3431]
MKIQKSKGKLAWWETPSWWDLPIRWLEFPPDSPMFQLAETSLL